MVLLIRDVLLPIVEIYLRNCNEQYKCGNTTKYTLSQGRFLYSQCFHPINLKLAS